MHHITSWGSLVEKQLVQLELGAEIFESAKKNGPILIVKSNNGKEFRYLSLIEG
jgi:hypothetical protein